jgi:phage baseplate assembly protein W
MSILLGRGWKFPLCFDARVKNVAMVEDVEDIEESLRILLTTSPGERVMNPDYGCAIRSVMFELLDENVLTELRELIRKAILFFEPRITLNRIDMQVLDSLEGRLSIVLDYTVRTTNTRHNLVYPLYLKQATNPVGPL